MKENIAVYSEPTLERNILCHIMAIELSDFCIKMLVGRTFRATNILIGRKNPCTVYYFL